PATYTLSLHDALPIYEVPLRPFGDGGIGVGFDDVTMTVELLLLGAVARGRLLGGLPRVPSHVHRDPARVVGGDLVLVGPEIGLKDRKSTRLNSSHVAI